MFTETVVQVLDRFAAPHGIDRYIEQVMPTWSSTEVRARITRIRRTTPDSATLTLRPNRHWAGHDAGQHTQLTVEIDGVRHTRCYSLSHAAVPDARSIEITVKAHPDGLVSNHLVHRTEPGAIVTVSPAIGRFTLPRRRPDRLLLISGGSGITPVLSMLRTLCAEGHRRPVTFLHYARTADDHILRAEIDALIADHPNMAAKRVYTDAPGTGDADGPFTAEQLAAIEPGWADAETFVCGPAPLMDAVVAHYDRAGRADHVHREAFTLGNVLAEAGAGGGTIHLRSSGQSLDNDGRSLLAQAEAAGLDPRSGCRMGICHTCVRSLHHGTVTNLVTGEVTTGDGSAVRICINAPVGDVEVDL